MQHPNLKVPLAANGPQFSRLVAGVMYWGQWGSRLSTEQMADLLEVCVNEGVTTIDHADIYGGYTTEAAFGKALALRPDLRDHIQLVSKCGIKLVTEERPNHQIKSYSHTKDYIIWSAEQSLSALGVDTLDLLLIHRPSPLMHPDELAEAFTHLHEAGKVQHFGASNFTPSQFAMVHSRFPLVTNQVEASLQHVAPLFDGTFDQALSYGLRPMVWSPLGGGTIFKGPERTPYEEALWNAITEQSEGYGLTQMQVMLAWLLHHPAGLLPVVGTTKPERIRESVQALNVTLQDEDWFRLLQASREHEVA